MKTLKIKLKAPPFSTNAAYVRARSHGSRLIRNKKCRDWGDSILLQLQSYREEMAAFREDFDPTSHALSIKIVFSIPEKTFYTKSGEVSLFSKDLSNVEKLLIDLLLDDRFNGRTVFGERVDNLSINDKLVIRLTSEKRPISGDAYLTALTIKKLDNKTFKAV